MKKSLEKKLDRIIELLAELNQKLSPSEAAQEKVSLEEAVSKEVVLEEAVAGKRREKVRAPQAKKGRQPKAALTREASGKEGKKPEKRKAAERNA